MLRDALQSSFQTTDLRLGKGLIAQLAGDGIADNSSQLYSNRRHNMHGAHKTYYIQS